MQERMSKTSVPTFSEGYRKESNIYMEKQDQIINNSCPSFGQEGQDLCFRLIAPKYTPREAILYQKSWNCKLVVKVRLTVFAPSINTAEGSFPSIPYSATTFGQEAFSLASSFSEGEKAHSVAQKQPPTCSPLGRDASTEGDTFGEGMQKIRGSNLRSLNSNSVEKEKNVNLIGGTAAHPVPALTTEDIKGKNEGVTEVPKLMETFPVSTNIKFFVKSNKRFNGSYFNREKKYPTVSYRNFHKKSELPLDLPYVYGDRIGVSTHLGRLAGPSTKNSTLIDYLKSRCTTINFQSKKRTNLTYAVSLPPILSSFSQSYINTMDCMLTKQKNMKQTGKKKTIFSILCAFPLGVSVRRKEAKQGDAQRSKHGEKAHSVPQKNKWMGKNRKTTPKPEKRFDKAPSVSLSVRNVATSNENVNNNEVRHELFLVLGELPLMTKRGNFIINGSPRTILSQLVRTPGIYFTERDNELQADCIPEQGPWLCIYKSLNASEMDDSVERQRDNVISSYNQEKKHNSQKLADYVHGDTSLSERQELNKKMEVIQKDKGTNSLQLRHPNIFQKNGDSKNLSKQKESLSSFFCYTKQFSSAPFSLVYSNFRTFELHSQFTDQSLLLTKLKTLEKIRQLREAISALLTFTYKKRIRKRLRKLYAKRCFIATQQFEKTKVLFRLKKKLDLGFLGRKSFYEKLGMSSCINIWNIQNSYKIPYYTIENSNRHASFPWPMITSFPSPSVTCSPLEAKSKVKELNSNSLLLTSYPLSQSDASSASSVPLLSFLRTGSTLDAGRKGRTMHTFGDTFGGGKETTPFDNSPILMAKGLTPGRPASLVSTQNEYTFNNGKHVYKTAASSPLIQNTLSINSLQLATLSSQDLALIVSVLNSSKTVAQDDIDDLNNQKVRTPSEQVQQQVRVGCLRFKKMFIKLVKESWGVSQTITDLLNGALREFFGSNPLSQFLDQTNPLAEITHKRRISKLGIGGIQRESATLKVRTIHSTYFGRICPIETPEGLNAGLVNSLTCLSRVNSQGQLVTPLASLVQRQMQNHFYFYSNKEKEAISTVDTPLLKFQRLPNQFIYTKSTGETISEFQQLEWNRVNLRVKSDLQTISLATALIPFLAYDDANRALMGSNMQRQAVPLISPERPIIRTGLESLVINESGYSFESPKAGFISYVSAQSVMVQTNLINKRTLAKAT